MMAVWWFGAVTNQHHSAFSVPHFAFRILHSAIPHFTHSLHIRMIIAKDIRILFVFLYQFFTNCQL